MSLEREPLPSTLGIAWRQGADHLRQAGVEEADADAELLLLYLLGISKAELLRDLRERFPVAKADAWLELLERRVNGVPVQYIIGEQYFFGRAFEVSESVLIPRPETELLAEAVLEVADRLWPDQAAPPVVLDVGTGSGILAVTLAAERPWWRVIASDLSPDAIGMARRNAQKQEVASRITFVKGDLLTPFLAGDEYPSIDVLVSNPPYIPSSDISGLQREVRDHEPRLALDGGEDGLNPYRIMAGQLSLMPVLPRVVAWEVGAGQADDVATLLRDAEVWDEIRFVKDYAGIDRHVIAVK
ncbi:peptide chain release factor N(5)-glutamine methyltransferase [Cohnella luojiensis]|uniref:Release factor glutamine methyltransferase n=1 Tax=Cohnella luojiensis TaxID=652876 RepID=A0A4Y8M1V8_9BACL|nr:peptide chain release factor N(5)-glutamine methyltransferase [Cohnella luojiensis]TFE28949.1 peptide chain release factor N(5)-glutamine methyltransferase [Cohnella luojiensis]